MILTTCAACAAPLAHNAPRCVRCKLRYCNATCQHDHWRRGHKQICKKIHRGGNAEKYHADKKYKEAVAAAVEACADDTKGQTCYICTQALHWKTKEGLVRMCACRGTSGFAHVSCLAEQAKILVAEAEENNWDIKRWNARWIRWFTCSLCEQRYHGVVCCALGWACWKTYVDRPEADGNRRKAINVLGNSLDDVCAPTLFRDSLSVREAELAMERRLGAPEDDILASQGNLANTYEKLGRREDALSLRREVYARRRVLAPEHPHTLMSAMNLANSLCSNAQFTEVKVLMNELLPTARRVFGDAHEITIGLRYLLSRSVVDNPDATKQDLRRAKGELEDLLRTTRRLFGTSHPRFEIVQDAIEKANENIETRKANMRLSLGI